MSVIFAFSSTLIKMTNTPGSAANMWDRIAFGFSEDGEDVTIPREETTLVGGR
jgi:hypothetical protein